MITGYLHPKYAQSLAELGDPLHLHHCGGWILQRQIPEFDGYDGMGCYPLFCCRDWTKLQLDLQELTGRLVSLALVVDPFGDYQISEIERDFRDKIIPFKQHFVIDLSRSPKMFVSKHHQRNARKALGQIQIDRCLEPVDYLDDWIRLYNTLIERHNIMGLRAFSRDAFARQLSTPGAVVFRAAYQGETVGMTIWYVQNEIGYYHLGAYSDLGYQLQASFGLFWQTLEYFADNGLKWLNLGAGAGLTDKVTDGLSRFKQGWSTGTQTAYFCGRIFDERKYKQLVTVNQAKNSNYFPAYRTEEFL